MKIIALHGKHSKGKSAIVDDADYEDIASYRWVVNYYGYAVRSAHKDAGYGATKLMHRHVMNPTKDQLIDHINGNRLDNRRSNLRIATYSENQRNRGKQNNNTSGFKGVVLLKDHSRRKKWAAQIKANGKQIRIGYYHTPEEASQEYIEASNKHYGEFSHASTL